MGGTQGERGRWQLFRNRTSYSGMYLAGMGLVLILFTAVIDWIHGEHSAYVGLLLILFLGMVLLGGVLTLFGAWRGQRCKKTGAPPGRRLNLNDPADRRKFHLICILGVVALNVAVFGSYAGYRYTESVSFCGTLCHPMNPEYVTHQMSPHANVACAECHVGAGFKYFVKYKLAGTQMLFSMFSNNFPRPVPTPLESMRPAREICESCHWPSRFFGTKLLQRPYFRNDEKNTPEQITLGVKIGGQIFHSIHFNHISGVEKIEYVAEDQQEQQIPWIAVTRLDGTTEEYLIRDPKTPDKNFADRAKTFDCIGCHNRPTHIFYTPDRAVNIMLAANLIPRDLPWIKKVAADALGSSYPDRQQAHAGIDKAIKGFYEERYPDLSQTRNNDINQTVGKVTALYDQLVFPEMKANWTSHPDNLGHKDWDGCFRCHDDRHTTADGKVLSRKCTVCHTEPTRGPLQPLGIMSSDSPGAQASWHPLDLTGKHGQLLCSSCHGGGVTPSNACTDCHDIDPKAPMMKKQDCASCHKGSDIVSCKSCHTGKGWHLHDVHHASNCTACHKPHQWRVKGREACMECHGDKKEHNPGKDCAPCHLFK